MAEWRVIKGARPKEEVRGADELLPSKRTHQVLGTGNFSQGVIMEHFFNRPGPAPRAVCPLSSQTNDDPPTTPTTTFSLEISCPSDKLIKKKKTHKCTKVKNLQQHLMLDATTAVFSAWQCPPLHRKKPRYVKESEKGKKKRHIRMCQLGIKCLEGSCEPIST